MKVEHFSIVADLMNARDKLNTAIKQSLEFAKDIVPEPTSAVRVNEEGVLNGGYYSNLSMHSDGSGPTIKMDGCYVGQAMAVATTEVLRTKLLEVESRLNELGVEL